MNKYLVGKSKSEVEDSEMVIINANNKEEAIDKYIANMIIDDEVFLEDVYNINPNWSYAEIFFRDENDELIYDEYGETRYSEEEIKEYFLNNIKKLFRNNDNWYNFYMKLVNNEEVVFPKEMLVYMFKNDKYGGGTIFCKNIEKDLPEIV